MVLENGRERPMVMENGVEQIIKLVTRRYESLYAAAERMAEDDRAAVSLTAEEFNNRRDLHLDNLIHIYTSLANPESTDLFGLAQALEQQLFRNNVGSGNTCHLLFDLWEDLKADICTGEWRTWGRK